MGCHCNLPSIAGLASLGRRQLRLAAGVAAGRSAHHQTPGILPALVEAGSQAMNASRLA